MATTVTTTGITFPDATTQTTAASAAFTAGTVMLFAQTAAPTGWTKSTAHNNKALRIVSGTASSGGSVAFTTAFASQSVSGTVSVTASTGQTAAPVSVGATTLTTPQITSHSHTMPLAGTSGTAYIAPNPDFPNPGRTNPGNTGSTGGGASHTHPGSGGQHSHPVSAPASFSGTAINLAVQYVDVILATKN
jgi:hypothetical protein